jgi:hypothetical protein
MEAVACQRILALQDLDPTHFRHDDDGASHSAAIALRCDVEFLKIAAH